MSISTITASGRCPNLQPMMSHHVPASGRCPLQHQKWLTPSLFDHQRWKWMLHLNHLRCHLAIFHHQRFCSTLRDVRIHPKMSPGHLFWSHWLVFWPKMTFNSSRQTQGPQTNLNQCCLRMAGKTPQHWLWQDVLWRPQMTPDNPINSMPQNGRHKNPTLTMTKMSPEEPRDPWRTQRPQTTINTMDPTLQPENGRHKTTIILSICNLLRDLTDNFTILPFARIIW